MNRTWRFAVVGFFIGAVIGFMLRPSVIFLGQLPLGTVLARGSNLTGLDRLLVPTAEASFNMMLVSAVVCAGIAAAIAALGSNKASA